MTKLEIEKLLQDVVRPIYKIEQDLEMPQNTLQKALKGRRSLPKKWALKLTEYVQKKRYIAASVLEKKEPIKEKTSEPDATPKDSNASEAISFMEQLRRKKLGLK